MNRVAFMILKHQASSETNHGGKEIGRRERAEIQNLGRAFLWETSEAGKIRIRRSSEHKSFHYFSYEDQVKNVKM